MKSKIFPNRSNKVFHDKKKSPRIISGDSRNTRNAKKSFRRKIASAQKKKFANRKQSHEESKKWKGKKPVRSYQNFGVSVRYADGVEAFCRMNKKKKYEQFRGEIKLASDFDLERNANTVLDTLLKLLYNAKKSKKFAKIKYSGNVSFGALYLLDSVCCEIGSKRQKWSLLANDISRRDYAIQSRLKSFKTGETITDDAYIYNNRIKINRSDDKLAKQDHKVASATVRDLINKAIQETTGKSNELSLEEIGAIESAISEHFDNILQHVPDAIFGNLCTFFDRNSKEVTILIFNYGHSIAHSIEHNELPEEVGEVVNEVISNYQKRGFLGLDSKFNKENALTLLAIQEGISSKLSSDKSRGHGIMDVIQKAKEMDSRSRMTIISGKTVLKINEKAKIEEKFIFGRKRRIVALNEENDILSKPSDKFVETMKVFFPGVIIETVIPININS